MHLAGIFASLLETYTQGFRKRFFVIPKAPTATNSFPNDLSEILGVGQNLVDGNTTGVEGDFGLEQDWLAHPFDSSIAPFGIGITESMCGFDDELNFIWSIGS
jgi:hypothetical protein